MNNKASNNMLNGFIKGLTVAYHLTQESEITSLEHLREVIVKLIHVCGKKGYEELKHILDINKVMEETKKELLEHPLLLV